MSSQIEVQRICQLCGNEFIAKTTVTRFCSHKCASAAYKKKVRSGKIEESNKQTQRIKNLPIEELKAQEFLTVTQVSKLIGCSRQNVYLLINNGRLKATNILLKKTIVKRSDLDMLFIKTTSKLKPESISEKQNQELDEWIKTGIFNISDCYNLTEVEKKHGISQTGLQQIIQRNNIPMIIVGQFSYVPKAMLDKLFQ